MQFEVLSCTFVTCFELIRVFESLPFSKVESFCLSKQSLAIIYPDSFDDQKVTYVFAVLSQYFSRQKLASIPSRRQFTSSTSFLIDLWAVTKTRNSKVKRLRQINETNETTQMKRSKRNNRNETAKTSFNKMNLPRDVRSQPLYSFVLIMVYS